MDITANVKEVMEKEELEVRQDNQGPTRALTLPFSALTIFFPNSTPEKIPFYSSSGKLFLYIH